jgi:alkaline phosphatase D
VLTAGRNFCLKPLSPSRKLIRNEQLTWLGSQINADTAKWKVLGQQILMTKMLIPAELLMLLNQILAEVDQLGSAQPSTMQALINTISQLVVIKMRYKQSDPSLTAQEIARVTTTLPYNLDAWDGYFCRTRTIVCDAFRKKCCGFSRRHS